MFFASFSTLISVFLILFFNSKIQFLSSFQEKHQQQGTIFKEKVLKNKQPAWNQLLVKKAKHVELKGELRSRRLLECRSQLRLHCNVFFLVPVIFTLWWCRFRWVSIFVVLPERYPISAELCWHTLEYFTRKPKCSRSSSLLVVVAMTHTGYTCSSRLKINTLVFQELPRAQPCTQLKRFTTNTCIVTPPTCECSYSKLSCRLCFS